MGSQTGKDESVSLGKRIRLLRKQKARTLEQLYQQSDLARSTLLKIENDLMSPTYDAMLKLATGFGVDISGLFSNPQERDCEKQRVVTNIASKIPGRISPLRGGIYLCTGGHH